MSVPAEREKIEGKKKYAHTHKHLIYIYKIH